jgi:RHS repeat-associated protein
MIFQHLQYLPYGELFVSQRNSDDFDSRYKFTAKELDNETSYTYFGARYYDADLSSWLSVDPLSDKYPSTSAYMYCSGNPVKLIDPNGLDTAFADNQARKDFLSTQSIVNNRISEISNKISNLKNQTYTKKIERQIKGLESSLYGLQKIKDDIDYICSPNTPLITYSTDETHILPENDGEIHYDFYLESGNIISANIYIRPGKLSAYIHENRHSRQNALTNICEREKEAYQYQYIFSPTDVQKIIQNARDDEFYFIKSSVNYDPAAIPQKYYNYGLDDMIRFRYNNCK